MTPSTCHICNHGEAYHDRWGICSITGCEPCYTQLPCPRCKHTFFEHTISDERVMCTVRQCNLLMCYNKKWPEKPLYTSGALAITPRRVQPTYEESLQHPLSPQPQTLLPIVVASPATAPLVLDNDPMIEPGLWKEYKSGRVYVSARNGYVEIDPNEKNENGSYKHHAIGRTWDTKYRGYIEDTPPAPPERGFLD